MHFLPPSLLSILNPLRSNGSSFQEIKKKKKRSKKKIAIETKIPRLPQPRMNGVEPAIHSSRWVQVPSFHTRKGLLEPAFISSWPPTSHCSEVSFEAVPGCECCGCCLLQPHYIGAMGSGGLWTSMPLVLYPPSPSASAWGKREEGE